MFCAWRVVADNRSRVRPSSGQGWASPETKRRRGPVMALGVGEFSARGSRENHEGRQKAGHEGVGKARAALMASRVVQRTVRGEFLARGSGREEAWCSRFWIRVGVG